MKILAFETSCDDTAVAIVENGTKVLASVRNSQPDHSEWGGVVPELAARLHAENWRKTLEDCLDQANVSLSDIDALAVTQGPGLQTSLLTGTTVTSFLGMLHQKPVIPVHHILGHITSCVLDRKIPGILFPSLVLTVSGGHTSMYLYRDFTDVQLLGTTLDDAAGEAFDKCAKMLGLGYPGGPIVSDLAQKGDRNAYQFPRIFLEKESFDFSFSGLKAAVYREIEKNPLAPLSGEKENKKSQEKNEWENFCADICASFEEAVKDTFLEKIRRAFSAFPDIRQVHFVGGVSANTYLREKFLGFCSEKGIELLVPAQFEYCTDNAAMIASAAYFEYQKNPGILEKGFIEPDPRLQF